MTALPTQDEAREMLAQFQQERERRQIEALIADRPVLPPTNQDGIDRFSAADGGYREMSNTEFALRRETEAAKDLMIHLRQAGAADDAELVADAVEGETSLQEALAAALDEIDECEVIEAGAKVKAEQYEARASAAKERASRIRACIEQALVAIDLKEPMRLPAATLSIAKRAPNLIIVNEAEIPSRFFVEQPRPAPKLDKKALLAALKDLPAGETIPGANLDNGTISLTIRRK